MANSCIGEGLLRALYRPFAMRDISFAPQRYKIPTINYYNIVLISGGEEIRGQKSDYSDGSESSESPDVSS